MKTKNHANYINGAYCLPFTKQIVSGVPNYVMQVCREDFEKEKTVIALVAYFYDAGEFAIQAGDVALTKSTLKFLIDKMDPITFRLLRRRFQAYERNEL